MHNFVGFEHTVKGGSSTVGASAGDVTIPQPPSIGTLGPSIDRVDELFADELELTAPSSNGDLIYVDLERAAAVATGKPIRPGETKRFSGAMKTTLSAIALSGVQAIEITAFYR